MARSRWCCCRSLTALIIAWDRAVRRHRNPSLSPVDPRAILLLAAIGVVSHPVLDWLNTYGIRLLMPFSERWFHADAVFIIDPWLWLMLGLGLFLPRRTAKRVQQFGAAALAYVVVMIGLSATAESIARGHAESAGITGVTDVMYAPAPASARGRHHRGDRLGVSRREVPMARTGSEPGAVDGAGDPAGRLG